MIISHAKQFILMAPWKAASSTCYESLHSYNESRYPRSFYFNKILNRVVHQHATISDLMSLPESKHGYKLASFVRSPYDRAYSGFLQIQRDFQNQPKLKFEPKWIASLIKDQITENMHRVISAGFEFDDWIQLLPDYEVFESGRNTNMVLHPCHYWTHINSEQVVNFIGRVEHFDTDFGRLCEYVGINQPVIKLENVSNEISLQASRESKYSARMSRRALDRVNDLFAQDFDYFGYEML